MEQRKLLIFMIIAGVLVLIISAIAIYRHTNSAYRNYIRNVERNLAALPDHEAELISEKDLAHLPEPVRRYLEYTGAVGTEKVRYYSVRFDGDFRMNKERDWAPVTVEQVSIIHNPVRLFFMKLKYMGMTVFGLHHYESAAASMVIRIMDLITVVDEQGPEMNSGETVTIFNDMCVLAPSSLIDPGISWRQIDDLTVEGSFSNEGISVSGILYFNREGQLINFSSEDRYYLNEDGGYDLIRWETPLSDYRDINGLKLAGYGEAVWITPDGPFPYARFNIRDVKINP